VRARIVRSEALLRVVPDQEVIVPRRVSLMHQLRLLIAQSAPVALVVVLSISGTTRADVFFTQTNLVSDVPGLAPVTDANLKNPWGMSASATSPFWVSNQVTGTATLYNGLGTPVPLVVTIPGAPGAGPTGQVFNPTTDFRLNNGNKANFIFSNLDGSISGWNAGTVAEVHVTNTAPTVYTGLAFANNGSANLLYAADARGGKVDVFNGQWVKTTLAGSFSDPNLPSGFVPYNVQAIGSTLYVTYENRTAGGGVVNAFDLNGNFIRRIAANASGGILDDPWGVVVAPVGFGLFGGDLLIGNKKNAHISAFNLSTPTPTLAGQLSDASGNPIANTGLWGLSFGNGSGGASPSTLYFVAGINNETNGLFGTIRAVPEPSTILLMGTGVVLAGAIIRRYLARSA